jgi:hypothetical protein
MNSLGDNSPARSAERARGETQNGAAWSAVIGNERLTTLAGGVLLVLIVAELVTTAALHALLSVHVFVGVLLAGPLVVKLGSTGYRFLRYYAGVPVFVRKGPPRLALRVLAPLLVATTLVLIGSGIGLLVTGPAQPGPLLGAHNVSALLWLPMIAIHTVAYVWRIPRSLVDDWGNPATEPAPGRGLRLSVNLGALLFGALAAVFVLPSAAPWVAWIQTGQNVPAPLVVGLVMAALALLVTRPFRWR